MAKNGYSLACAREGTWDAFQETSEVGARIRKVHRSKMAGRRRGCRVWNKPAA